MWDTVILCTLWYSQPKYGDTWELSSTKTLLRVSYSSRLGKVRAFILFSDWSAGMSQRNSSDLTINFVNTFWNVLSACLLILCFKKLIQNVSTVTWSGISNVVNIKYAKNVTTTTVNSTTYCYWYKCSVSVKSFVMSNYKSSGKYKIKNYMQSSDLKVLQNENWLLCR